MIRFFLFTKMRDKVGTVYIESKVPYSHQGLGVQTLLCIDPFMLNVNNVSFKLDSLNFILECLTIYMYYGYLCNYYILRMVHFDILK